MTAANERPGRSAQGAETRSRILAAARSVLAEGGIERFTTRRVAAAAGVSHGMCHYHFKDKRDLLLALIEHARSDWVEPLDRLVDGTGSADARARVVISWMAEPATIEVMRVHSALFWFALGDDVVRARLAGEYARWRLPFVTLFREVAAELGLRDFDARGVGEAFASAADGLVQQQSLDPDLPIKDLLGSLYERLVDGRPRRRRPGAQSSRKRR